MDLDRVESTKHRGGLADFLRARPERVLEQWEASERASVAFAEGLREHIGEMLLRVAAHMDRGAIAPIALDGVTLRAQPTAIAGEMGLLRCAVLDAWIDDGGGALDPDDVARFGRAFDAALVAALSQWSDGVVRREITTGEHRIAGLPRTATPVPIDHSEMTRVVEILARELRAPLHAVAFSMAKLLEDHALPDAVRTGMQKTARGAERMVERVDDVLDFAHVRLRGGLEVNRRAFNMVDLARAVVEKEDAAPGCRRTRLHSEGDTSGFWDKDRIGQLLARLLVNARRHGDANAALEVHVHGDGTCVELRVGNSGHLDPETLSQLFQPFRPRDEKRGVGLGLFLVEAIARAHGGSVSASSDGGRTWFVVRLPRAPW